jgi:hypothetical protein
MSISALYIIQICLFSTFSRNILQEWKKGTTFKIYQLSVEIFHFWISGVVDLLGRKIEGPSNTGIWKRYV